MCVCVRTYVRVFLCVRAWGGGGGGGGGGGVVCEESIILINDF